MRNKLFLRIEEIILFLLVLLNVLDFAEKLSSDFDYIKKVISFILMFYLFYRASLSKQFFGHQDRDFDFLLVFAMFSMVFIRSAVQVALTAEEGFLTPIFYLLKTNATAFEIAGLYFGLILLLGLAIYTGVKFKIKKPSLLSIIHEKNEEPSWQKALTNYLLFLAFFLFIFNLFFEWLTIAIDAPLVSLGLVFYLFIAWKKHHFDPESTLFKVGNFGERFYEYFVTHFKYREKLKLGIAGMLILHLITDLGVFIVPAILGLSDPLYEVIFANNHYSLWQMAKMLGTSTVQVFLYFIQYLLATVGFILLMIIPVLVWRAIYFKKKLETKRWFNALFYSSLLSLVLTPIYRLVALKESFYGVDIQTVPVTINVLLSLPLFVLVFLTIYWLSKYLNRSLSIGSYVFSTAFFFWYVINYFISSINYYSSASIFLFRSDLLGLGPLGINFFLFLMLIIIFYFAGFWFYIRALIKKVTI